LTNLIKLPVIARSPELAGYANRFPKGDEAISGVEWSPYEIDFAVKGESGVKKIPY